ncbi:RNA cap guanine-N2 methyltransferase-domain-containing protein [Dipodascopsis tothii]|uniref:RNA cap guanine-N2 methyltransferase-domain-containing protein n=1 Tax=Dipodascopsis tothii TaxID=44089 RepID=UPI0034CEE57C
MTESASQPLGVTYTDQSIPHYLNKYWAQRNFLFSKYNDGIWLNEESWFSATPEPIARSIAEHFANACNPRVVVDAFCGAGGNTIQFAQYCDRVIAIDVNPTTLACAQHNAEIYGVSDKIEFILGDFFDYVSHIQADAVFLSPPWGGPSYLMADIYDLDNMAPYNLPTLLKASRIISPNTALYLPRNSNREQIKSAAESTTTNSDCLVTYLFAKSKCKALCAYYGDLSISGNIRG